MIAIKSKFLDLMLKLDVDLMLDLMLGLILVYLFFLFSAYNAIIYISCYRYSNVANRAVLLIKNLSLF